MKPKRQQNLPSPFVLDEGQLKTSTSESKDSVLSNVRKRGKASRVRLEDSSEISRYPGKWNDIIVEKEYFHDFKCNFDLSNYPFDQQKCFMNFTLRRTTDRQVILCKCGGGIQEVKDLLLSECVFQFILLIGVGFMSLILPFNNFMDRVMTALTVMLVMTCNQQVLNVSQKEEEKSIPMTKF